MAPLPPVPQRLALLAALVAAVTGLCVSASAATKSSHLLVRINDEANTLYGNPGYAFPVLKELHAQVLRVNLYWGGTQWAVANDRRPADPNDPGDRAYTWTLYDRLARYAAQYNIGSVWSQRTDPTQHAEGLARLATACLIDESQQLGTPEACTQLQKLVGPRYRWPTPVADPLIDSTHGL